jgi:hypothetical protein
MGIGLDLWGKSLSRGYDPRNTVVISGSPRGGTSWVAEVIATTPGSLLLWEPLEPSSHPNILEKLGIGYDPYVPHDLRVTPDMPEKALYEYLKDVIAGRVPFTEYLRFLRWRHLPVRNLLSLERYIVKFIRGNLLLYWLLREFQLKGVLILRHPCAVVASQMHFAWKNALQWRTRWVPFLERYDPSLLKVVDSLRTDEEVLAMDWAVTNLVPLRQPKPHPWLLVAYEDLVSSIKEWERLCSHISCPVPPVGIITKESTTTRLRDTESKAMFSLDKWRKHLSEKQIDAILRVCSDMGIDFYDNTGYPKNLDRYR